MHQVTKLMLNAVLGSLLAFSLNARATTLASDNFTLSSGTNLAMITDTESSGVGIYSVIQGTNTTALSITNITGFGTGNVLRWPGGGETYYRAFNSDTTLTLNNLATGETLRLAFDIRFAGFFSSADNFSFGFVGTSVPNSIAYANLDLNSGGGYASEFRYRTNSFNMSDNIASAIIGNTFTEPASVSGTGYTMKLEVTRLTNGFRLDYHRDGSLTGTTTGLTATAFVTTMSTATISGIAFRGVVGLTTYIDNLLVERTLNLPTPTISGVTPSQSILSGTSSITLTGIVSAAGPVYPADGEVVAVTINGVTSNATVSGGAGGFTVEYPTATLDTLGSPYTITYAYAGGINLSAAADDTSTTLTVLPSGPEPTGSTNTSIVLSSGQIRFDFALASGAVYRVQANTNLLDGSGWSDLTDPLTNDAGASTYFMDMNTSAFPARSYRVTSP